METPQIPLGERVEGRRDDFQAALDSIYAGYRRHYDSSATDRDLDLLEGDRQYADGLVGLAQLEDLSAVAVFAEAISLLALANVAERPDLVESLWTGTASAVSQGEQGQFDDVKKELVGNG